MAEFSAVANLEIVPTGIDAARRQIERELGDVEVGVSSQRPTGAVGSRGPEPAGVDLSRRQLGQQEALVDLAGERNELLEELLEGGGGGGGGLGAAGGGFAAGRLGGAAAGFAGGAALTGGVGLAFLGTLLAGGAAGQAGAGALDEAFPNARGSDIIAGTSVAREPGEPILGGFIEQLSGLVGEGVQGGQQTIRNVFNFNNQVAVDPSLARSEQQRFNQAQVRNQVEPIINTELQRFEQRLEQRLGGGTESRTAGGAPGGRFRR